MISEEPIRGGIRETLGGKPYQMRLRIGEIERFEDAHRGVFDVWDGFFRDGKKPNSKEIRDLVALGLVGGGLADADADAIVAGLGTDGLLSLYEIAQGLLGIAFLPDLELEQDKKKAEATPPEDSAPEA
jgi:hypothetical protein